MSDQAIDLLSALEAAGTQVALGTTGTTLELTGKHPPPDLLTRVHVFKSALLEALKTMLSEQTVSVAVPAANITARSCNTCAGWTAMPAPLAHMGLCDAGREAHGWQDGNPHKPVELQGGCQCLAYAGKGYRDRVRVGATSQQNPD